MNVMYSGRVEQHTVNTETYLNDIIISIVLPFDRNYGIDFILVVDNTRPHRAPLVTEILQTKLIV